MKWQFDNGGRPPGGRKAADCVVRALAIASPMPYGVAWKLIRDHVTPTPDAGVLTSNAPFHRFMRRHGWQWCPTWKYGVMLGADSWNGGHNLGPLIVAVAGGHYCAVMGDTLHDTDGAAFGRRIRGFWCAVPNL